LPLLLEWTGSYGDVVAALCLVHDLVSLAVVSD
jgi:hypothetical protein